MTELLTPLLYGTLIAVCFPIGAVLVSKVHLSHNIIAATMSVGAGLLLAAATLDLTFKSVEHVGALVTVPILIASAAVFSTANWYMSKGGGRNRKRCGDCVAQATEEDTPGSGKAIALGTVLDAFPEALVLGVVLSGSGNAIALTIALAIGNIAQSVSSTAGLSNAGRSTRFIATLWGGLALFVVATTVLSFAVLGSVGDTARPLIEAFAAGILIAMTCEAMLPEASDKNPSFRGLQAAMGVSLFVLLHGLI